MTDRGVYRLAGAEHKSSASDGASLGFRLLLSRAAFVKRRDSQPSVMERAPRHPPRTPRAPLVGISMSVAMGRHSVHNAAPALNNTIVRVSALKGEVLEERCRFC